MIQLLRNRLRKTIWFAVGLFCVLLFAFGLSFTQSVSMATSPESHGSLHVYTPTNHPRTPYWSVGITRDETHLPSF
jgi:hypothetical protein